MQISSLRKSIASLQSALNVIDHWQGKANHEEMQTLRAGAIQNFEFTYELCWKLMKRWIEMNVGAEVVDGVTRIELFRVSAENRLITDVGKWMEFHKARNSTSHMYNEAIALNVFGQAVEFLPYAKDFYKRLEER